MKRTSYIVFSLFLLFAVFVVPTMAHALSFTPLVPCGIGGNNPCNICHLAVLLDNVIGFLIYFIAIPGAGLMIVIGGFMMLIGAGSESRVGTGKKMITNAIVGVLIVLLSWLIVDTAIKTLTGNFSAGNFTGAFGVWNKPSAANCPL